MVEHWSPKPGVAGSIPASPAINIVARKFPDIIQRGEADMFKKIADFFDGVVFEMKKVSWPTWQELKGSTIVVLILSLILSVFLFIVDIILSKLVHVIL